MSRPLSSVAMRALQRIVAIYPHAYADRPKGADKPSFVDLRIIRMLEDRDLVTRGLVPGTGGEPGRWFTLPTAKGLAVARGES